MIINTKTTINVLKIGDKVKYGNQTATVIALASAEMSKNYAAVVLEFKSIFADFGKQYDQLDRRTVIEYGLQKI